MIEIKETTIEDISNSDIAVQIRTQDLEVMAHEC